MAHNLKYLTENVVSGLFSGEVDVKNWNKLSRLLSLEKNAGTCRI